MEGPFNEEERDGMSNADDAGERDRTLRLLLQQQVIDVYTAAAMCNADHGGAQLNANNDDVS